MLWMAAYEGEGGGRIGRGWEEKGGGEGRLTVVVPEDLVEFNLALDQIAVDVGELGLERRAVELDPLGAEVERHGC